MYERDNESNVFHDFRGSPVAFVPADREFFMSSVDSQYMKIHGKNEICRCIKVIVLQTWYSGNLKLPQQASHNHWMLRKTLEEGSMRQREDDIFMFCTYNFFLSNSWNAVLQDFYKTIIGKGMRLCCSFVCLLFFNGAFFNGFLKRLKNTMMLPTDTY